MKLAAIAVIALFTATGALAQEEELAPQPIPNSVKYRDSKPNAKGVGQLATVLVEPLDGARSREGHGAGDRNGERRGR